LSSANYIVIERVMPLTQETDLLNQGAVYPQAIEDALDYLTMITQQLQDQLNRAIIFSVADTVEVTLPTATARANLFLGFNSSGDPIAIAGLNPSVTVSAAMIPVVTAPTTAAALTALGLPGALLDLLIPAGTIWSYALSAVPTGFALMFGQPVTGSWPVLRAALVGLGSPYGTNGVDPLLPDGRSRSLVGKSNMGGVDNGLWTGGTVLGAVAGAQSVTLITAQLPSHFHAVFAGVETHRHVYNPTVFSAGGGANIASNSTGSTGAPSLNTDFAATGLTVRDAAAGAGNANQTATTGSGNSHENRHPGLITNVLIKVH
jgi:microcystin-dependent protein